MRARPHYFQGCGTMDYTFAKNGKKLILRKKGLKDPIRTWDHSFSWSGVLAHTGEGVVTQKLKENVVNSLTPTGRKS